MEAERALETILRREPENPGALHFLALCRDDRGLYPEDLLRRSVAAYQRSGDAEGEGYARLSLFGYLCLAARRCDENLEQLDRVEELASRSGLRDMQALSLVYRAGAATMLDDVGAAERHLRNAESLIGPHGPAWLRGRVLERFGVLYVEAGRHAEAREKFEALAALTRNATPARHAAALGYLGTAALQLAQRRQLERAEAERLLREALEAEDRSGLDLHSRFSGSLVTRTQLAFLLGATPAGLAELERVKATDELRHARYPFVALWLLARFTYEHDRSDLRRALGYANEALGRCIRPSHAWERAHGLLVRGDLPVAEWRPGEGSGRRARGRWTPSSSCEGVSPRPACVRGTATRPPSPTSWRRGGCWTRHEARPIRRRPSRSWSGCVPACSSRTCSPRRGGERFLPTSGRAAWRSTTESPSCRSGSSIRGWAPSAIR
jgi:tetratricopeptide (TPR) repeat protein